VIKQQKIRRLHLETGTGEKKNEYYTSEGKLGPIR
jgi:hypothetical protein